jgi:hypothetical protein
MWLIRRSQPGVVRASVTKVGNIAGLARIAAAGFVLLLAALPADAMAAAGSEQGRATLSVSAVVAPSCQIDREGTARHAIACSVGTSFSTSTVAHRDEKPLSDAAAILGAPARGARGIEFAAPIRPAAFAQVQSTDEAAPRYLTITY